MEFDIGCFEKYRENNRLEVKKAKGGLPVSLWETYSSMSNCHGGTIILGIIEKDDGSFVTTGLKDVEKLKKDFSYLKGGYNLMESLQFLIIHFLITQIC